MRAIVLAMIAVALLACAGCQKEISVKCDGCPTPCDCCKECCKLPDHFWEEKRLAAVTEIAAACSDMSQVFFREAGKEAPCGVDRKIEYREKIALAVRAVNKHGPLLGKDFDRAMSLYIQLHRSFCEVGLLNCGDYLELAAAVENALDDVLKAALDGQPAADLPLARIRFAQRIKMSPQEYIDAAMKHWQRSLKK